ncbi:tetratricopeptide repeat protein [Gemmatimonas sp.]
MSNAAKHRKKAAEFEQLKQIDRAIASYVKAIEESESAGEDVDVALYNKVGDLALRQGRVPDAITYYERAVEHYATSGLFNNAIALCNKILRNAPGRANVYFTLGRISARKGLRGDATRNFLEYATRMQQEGRIEEGIRALAEVLDLMPELNDVRTMVEDLATRSGIALPRRKTPLRSDRVPTPVSSVAVRDQKSQDLIFLDIDYGEPSRRTPVSTTRLTTPSIPFLPPVLTPHSVPAIEGLDTMVAEEMPAEVAPLLELAPTAEETPVVVSGADASLEALADMGAASNAPAVPPVSAMLIEGLEANGDFGDGAGTVPLDGFTPDEVLSATDAVDPDVHPTDVTWVVPPEVESEATPLEELVSEDFLDATNDPGVVRAIYTATPPYVPSVVPDAEIDTHVIEIESHSIEMDVPSIEIEPLDVEAVPELDAAIEAGRALTELADMDAVQEVLPPTRPPFRLDPHDFILPGELPPLLLDDAVVDAGLAGTDLSEGGAAPDHMGAAVDALVTGVREPVRPPTAEAAPAEPVAADSDVDEEDTGRSTAGTEQADANLDEGRAVAEADGAREATDEDDATPSSRPVGVTPSLPIAAVAEAAANVASSRRDSLRAAVARLPKNWLLRRRLAEALFEAGERDAALHELETAQHGLVHDGEFAAACDIADELVHVSPDRVAYHQKRVELAVRASDQQRLRFAYLDLADALVRLGEEGRARAVYARVLEIDPHDDRARAALGAAAPPPPPPARPDDKFVDLADWLRDDDKPVDTRMRMREPAISGDEQADFDALLRHFKEGVSRSLGEDDFESHYDLGVAYKEMGLLDDAIAEFQKALRSRAHRLPAYEALGQCFVEQGRYQVAATVLSRALHEPGLDDDQRVGVLYLLAYSCEALQRRDEARSYFQRVYATDINFRDVAARLVALEQASR